MTAQAKLGFSLAFIACLLMFLIFPSETESTPAGWVGYGIIIGLLLSVAVRSASLLQYQASYKRRKTYRSR